MPSSAPRPPSAGGLRRVLTALCLCLGLAAGSFATVGGKGDPTSAVLAMARAHLGDSYVWGATGPRTWDCSGFTSTLWHDAGGVDVPRTSRQQQAWAVPLPLEQVLPGDLVFFGDPVTHVSLVLHRSGDDVTMIDASSSRKGVVQRQAWTGGVVRYGRVPRPGMVAVEPFTPAPQEPGTTGDASAPPTTPTTPTTPATPAPPAPRPRPHSPATPVTAAPASSGSSSLGMRGFEPVGAPRDLGTGAPASATAARAVELARAAVGNRRLTDAELVRNVWRRAGGPLLGTGRGDVVAAGHRIALSQARPGDLLVYPAPAAHVAIYLGRGLMIDGSRAQHRVVQRGVWDAKGLQVHRLPA